MNIQVENIVLPNKPLSNFEIEDAVKGLVWKTFVVFSWETLWQRNQNEMFEFFHEEGSVRQTSKILLETWRNYEPWRHFWRWDALGRVVQTWWWKVVFWLSRIASTNWTEQLSRWCVLSNRADSTKASSYLWPSLSFCFKRDAKRKRAAGNNQHILVI